MFGSFVLFSFFTAVEIILRIAGFSYVINPFERLGVQRIEPHWHSRGLIRDPSLPWSWIPGPGMTATQPLDNHFTYNSDGFIGPVYSLEKSADSVRIICMGDSCTMGWNSPSGKTYPDFLRNELNAVSPGQFELVNAGVSGYSSFQGLHDYHHRIRFWNPDFLVVSYNWNDHGDAPDRAGIPDAAGLESRKQYPDKDQPSGPVIDVNSSFLSGFRTVQSVFFLFDKATRPASPSKGGKQSAGSASDQQGFPPGTGLRRVSPDDFRKNLEQFVRLSQFHAFTLIFLTQPANPVQHRTIQPWMTMYEMQDQYNDIMRQIALEHDALIADAAVEKWHADMFYDHVHTRPEANRRIAELVMDKILHSITERQQVTD